MSYTINPNAKNKWARNAENTMDLSLETDASSVYLDDGRTLEQELGEGSMVSNVTTVDSSVSKVIDGTLDGAYESGIMYGKSLVNLVSNHKIKIANGTTNSFPMVIPMDAKKKYLISFKIDTAHTSTGEPNQSAIKLQYYSHNNNKGYNFIYNSELADGREFKFIVEPFSGEVSQDTNFFAIWLTRYESGTLHGKLSVFEYVDGMESWDIPYFDGLCDVKMPILRNVGKNLFNINQPYDHAFTPPQKYFIENNKLHFIGAKNHENLCWLIKVSKGERIYCSCLEENNKGKIDVRFFSEKGVSNNFTNRNSWDCNGTIKSTICSDEWMLLMLNTSTDSGDFVFTNIIVSYYDTTYEDHKSNILRTPETVTLRSLPNGVRDELNLNTGEYIKRIGEVVLDGSEDWQLMRSPNESTTIGFTYLFTSANFTQSQALINVVSNKLPSLYELWNLDTDGISIYKATTRIAIKINRSKLTTQDIAGIKAYLQQNPLTVQYELATPITTIVEPLTIPFAYQNGHIILESGYEGQSLLPTLEYSTVVNKTGLIENVAKTIQRQEKQLTMLEQMLIQNIINLDYNNTLLTLKNEMEEML